MDFGWDREPLAFREEVCAFIGTWRTPELLEEYSDVQEPEEYSDVQEEWTI